MPDPGYWIGRWTEEGGELAAALFFGDGDVEEEIGYGPLYGHLAVWRVERWAARNDCRPAPVRQINPP